MRVVQGLGTQFVDLVRGVLCLLGVFTVQDSIYIKVRSVSCGFLPSKGNPDLT